MTYLDLKAEYISRRDRRQYEQNIRATLIQSAQFCMAAQANPPAQLQITPIHPLTFIRATEYVNFIKANPGIDSINFGDSLTDFTREWLSDLNGVFSIAGSWHDHIAQMIELLSPFLNKDKIKYVYVGTSGGNPLIGFQDLNRTIERSINVAEVARASFPNSKVIIYGLPPTVELQVLPLSNEYCSRVSDGVSQISNTTFIDIRYRMGGAEANATYSADGVHLNPRGARVLNQLFKEAKTFSGKYLV